MIAGTKKKYFESHRKVSTDCELAEFMSAGSQFQMYGAVNTKSLLSTVESLTVGTAGVNRTFVWCFILSTVLISQMLRYGTR